MGRPTGTHRKSVVGKHSTNPPPPIPIIIIIIIVIRVHCTGSKENQRSAFDVVVQVYLYTDSIPTDCRVVDIMWYYIIIIFIIYYNKL